MKLGIWLLVMAGIIGLYLAATSCERGPAIYPKTVDMAYSVDDMSRSDMAWDMTYPNGRCGNGDSPDGGVGYCPCCEVRDEKCNIPEKEAEWCTACLDHEKSKGQMGDMYPCRKPVQ